tara:strand:- start:52401 stop:52916 length:516 start_codon:yes stop_codon:yes gene_type:complete
MIRSIRRKNNFYIYLSLILALCIDSLTFSSTFHFIKPSLVLLTLIYWNLAIPDKVGISLSLVFGLLSDVLMGTVLGIHYLLFVIITYFCQRFFYQIRVMPIYQQSIVFFFVFIFFKFTLSLDFFGVNIFKSNFSDITYLLNTIAFGVISALCWIPVFLILRKYRRRWITIE